MFFQGIEYKWCISVFVSAVKCEINFFIIGIVGIISIVRAKFFDGRISDRKLAFGLKTEPPAGRFGTGRSRCAITESCMQLSELCAEDKHAAEKKEKFWYKQVTLDGFHGTSQKTLFKNICRNAKKK